MFNLFKTPEPIVQINACQASPNLLLEGASGAFYILGFPKESGVSLEEVHFEFNQDELWTNQISGSILIVQGEYKEIRQRFRLELVEDDNRASPVCTAHFWRVEAYADFMVQTLAVSKILGVNSPISFA